MMNGVKSSSRNIALLVFFTFSITLMLFIISILYGLFHINKVNENIRTIVEQHNTKEHLVVDMHNQARERVVSLFKMGLIEDPFIRDDLFLGLNKNGAEFSRSRISLLDMALNEEELNLLNKQGEYTSVAVPIQNQIIELLNNDELEAARELLINEGVPAQDTVLHQLSELVDIQRRQASQILSKSNSQYGQASKFTLWLGIIASVFGFLIAIITSRKVYHDQLKLNKLNAELESRVAERTYALSQANAELEETIKALEHTQDYLIESEKLASLGSMVAGVAHELNTPLGNSVTATSTLQDTCIEFKKKLDTNKIKRNDLLEFLELSEAGTNLVMRNLTKASELVKSFKQVAVDQTSQKRREFLINNVIHEDVATIIPQFKKTRHQVVLELDENINFNSYPGPLGQVIINIILNALNHAFTEDMNGIVLISTEVVNNEQLAIVISDNGVGMPNHVLKKIFDPFFTTKLGKGGSGLGMHIVYNFVTGLLGGDIKILSSEGSGTKVNIILPVNAPEKQTD